MNEFAWLAAGMIIILAASFVQSLTSFGFALIALPLLSLFLPLHQAVPVIVIFSLFVCLGLAIANRRDIHLRQIWLLILAGVIAAPVGTYLLLAVHAEVLKAATGVLITLFAALMLIGRSFPIRSERAAFVTAGLLSGLLNGEIGGFVGWMFPAMLLGAWLGARAVSRFDERLFKVVSLWLILVSGIWTALSGFGWV